MTETILPGSLSEPELENLLAEKRRFPPSADFTAQANATAELYEEAERDYVAFWERLAREKLSWDTPLETTLDWQPPFAKCASCGHGFALSGVPCPAWADPEHLAQDDPIRSERGAQCGLLAQGGAPDTNLIATAPGRCGPLQAAA